MKYIVTIILMLFSISSFAAKYDVSIDNKTGKVLETTLHMHQCMHDTANLAVRLHKINPGINNYTIQTIGSGGCAFYPSIATFKLNDDPGSLFEFRSPAGWRIHSSNKAKFYKFRTTNSKKTFVIENK